MSCAEYREAARRFRKDTLSLLVDLVRRHGGRAFLEGRGAELRRAGGS